MTAEEVAERNAVIGRYLKKVRPVAYFRTSFPGLYDEAVVEVGADEVSGLCHLAVVRAAGTWRAAGGSSFRSYANRAMMSHVLAALKRWRHRRLPVSGAASSDVLPDGGAGPAEEAAGRDEARRLMAAVGRLPRRMAQAVTKVYGLDGRGPRLFREAAAEMGVSKSRVGQMVERARGRLADLLAPAGGGTAC